MHANTLSLLCLSTLMLLCRQHEAELRQSREECWAQEQELAAVREKLAHLKATLDDRRKDLVSYKVRTFAVFWKIVLQLVNTSTISVLTNVGKRSPHCIAPEAVRVGQLHI